MLSSRSIATDLGLSIILVGRNTGQSQVDHAPEPLRDPRPNSITDGEENRVKGES